MRRCCILLLLLLAWCQPLSAHPLAPSMLEVTELGDGQLGVMWKTPLKSAPGSRLAPVFPGHCQQSEDAQASDEGTARIYRWHMRCGQALVGSVLGVDNIASSQANALLRVVLADGRQFSRVLTPGDDRFTVPERQTAGQVFAQYVAYGAEHLATGLDHLLFVASLVLLVGLNRLLIVTITLFTVGHSVTLSLAALGYVDFPQSVADVFIALSIVLTAAAVVAGDPRRPVARWPWLVAFLFGLLHGLGFAGALAEVGLPQEEIPMALLAFNVGIELGQLGLIALLLPVMWLAGRVSEPGSRLWKVVPNYAVGCMASMWFWDRLAKLVGL